MPATSRGGASGLARIASCGDDDVGTLDGKKSGDADGYAAARDWVRDSLHWDIDGRLNVFETTIRVLGGLLSASALIADPPAGTLAASAADARLFEQRAEELAERLLHAFETPSGIPLREVNLLTGEAFPDTDNRNASSLAEATTIQLEFKTLAHRTGEEKFWRIAERPMTHAHAASAPPQMGILPIFVSVETGKFYLTEVRLGSRGDSYYEYLVKQYLLTNRTERVYRDMYEHAFDAIKSELLGLAEHTDPPMVHTTEIAPVPMQGQLSWRRINKQDHLVCFLGGTMMLGAAANTSNALRAPRMRDGQPAASVEDWRVGHELIRTCVDTYRSAKTGLAPEIAFFRPKHDTSSSGRNWAVKRYVAAAYATDASARPDAQQREPLIDSRNILRPETVESLYIAFQLTGDPIYREWGWQIFEAFRARCQVDGGAGGYAGIDDIDDEEPRLIDRMETYVWRPATTDRSFWLSETLKYLYLLFAERDLLPLHEWVFNTEAHPLPVFTPRFATRV